MGRRFRLLLQALFVAVLATSVAAPAAVRGAVAPPTIAMAFGAPTLVLGNSTSLTFTITNPNSGTALSGISFSDTFPYGLLVAYPNGLTGSCGGGAISAASYSTQVSLAGASLAANETCTFSVDVVGAAPGVQSNTTDPIAWAGGTGGSASASITVGTPATISMSFDPPGIPLNGTSTLTVALYNPETSDTDIPETGVTATLPAGLSIANGSGPVNPDVSDCGTLTTTGGNTIDISGVNLWIGWSCTARVTVTGPGVAGAYTTSAGPILTPGGIPSNTGSATLNVLAPPTIAMSFAAPSITLSSHGALIFTVTNPAGNGADIEGIAVTADLPAGLTVADGTVGACGGIVTTTGGKAIGLTGGVAPVASTCTFSVDVTGAVLGSYTAAGGPVTSSNAGSGNSATAGVTVVVEAATPAPATPSPTLPPGTTLPPSSTERGRSSDSNGSPILLFLLIATIVGMVVFRRAVVRGR